MVISVVSPFSSNSGNTVSSILLAMGLADFKRKVFLTHIEPTSPSFYQYLGLHNREDKTSTPSQLVKLMKAGAIKPDEITDYCKGINDYLDVFTNLDKNFTHEDMGSLLEFVTDVGGYEYKIFDIDCDFTNQYADMIIRKSDIVIFNFPPNNLVFDRYTEQKDRILKLCGGKKVILLCDGYCTEAGKLSAFSKKVGTNAKFSVIRKNNWITWGCNTGKLYEFYKKTKLKDYRLLEVGKDIYSLAKIVTKVKIVASKDKKRGV